MKKLFTILFALSLYAPQVSQLLAFSECSFTAITKEDQKICDCLLTSTSNKFTNESPVLPDKHEHHQLKGDWKFVKPEPINIDLTSFSFKKNNRFPTYVFFIPSTKKKEIFRPPCC